MKSISNARPFCKIFKFSSTFSRSNASTHRLVWRLAGGHVTLLSLLRPTFGLFQKKSSRRQVFGATKRILSFRKPGSRAGVGVPESQKKVSLISQLTECRSFSRSHSRSFELQFHTPVHSRLTAWQTPLGPIKATGQTKTNVTDWKTVLSLPCEPSPSFCQHLHLFCLVRLV